MSEVSYALILTKENLLEYSQTSRLSHPALEIYAEQELLIKFTRFFDYAIYCTVLGHERARVSHEPVLLAADLSEVDGATSADLARLCP